MTKNRDDIEASSDRSSLDSISEGAGLFFIGNMTTRGIGFILSVILTRSLGSSLYGIFAYISVVFSLVMVFTRLGGDKSILRYIPEYADDPRKQNLMLSLAYATSLIASVLVAVLLYIIAPLISTYTLNEELFVDVLRIAAFVIPFNTLSNITYSAFKSIDMMKYNVFVSSMVNPVLRLIFIGGAVILGYSLYGAVAGLVATGILTFIIAVLVIYRRTDLGGVEYPTKDEAFEYYNFSVPLTFNQLGNFLYNRVDILMVGYFLASSAVGVYNITVMLAGLLALPLKGFNQMFPPIASELYHKESYDQLDTVYATVTRWIFSLSLFPAIATVVFSHEILSIFGPDFARGKPVLMLFVLAQLTNCAVGPSGYLLMMTDHQYLTLINQLSSGILNAVLNVILILEFGFIGAAVATASVLAGINILRVVEVWYFEGFFPYEVTYYKPIVGGIFSAGSMILMGVIFDGFALLIMGGAAGGAVYLIVLYALGIEESERRMFDRIMSNIK